jgi:protein TonB
VAATQPPANIAVPPAAPRPERAAPVRVMPDPLTPRIAAPKSAQSPRSTATRAARSTFDSPISSGHAIAGYVTEPPAAESDAYPDPITQDYATAALPDADLEQLTATEPVYPPAALRHRIEGWVEVDFTVTESGGVRDIEVIDAEPRGVFDEAATAAVRQWRFRPRVANGRPVQQRSTVTLRFNVEG